jgi:hypothetical protein
MIRTFALLFGVVFTLVGIAGFIPGLVQPPTDHMDVGMNHGVLLGLFPINTPHNIVHLLFGLWGLAASRSFSGSRTYFQVVAIAYILLMIMGLLPQTQTTFGFVPIYGHDVWLHAVLGLVGAYFGFVHRERASDVR